MSSAHLGYDSCLETQVTSTLRHHWKSWYTRIPTELIPQEFIDLYQLQDKVKNDFVYFELLRGMYDLTEAGVLAKKLLKECLKEHDYFEVKHRPGLFNHETSQFCSP